MKAFAKQGIAQLEVKQGFWIETAREDERDMGPYRLCTDGGQRFSLSANEARQAMLEQGIEYRNLLHPIQDESKPCRCCNGVAYCDPNCNGYEPKS